MKRNSRSRRDQSGVSLIVVLTLLSILLLIGLAVLRSSLSQERMAAQSLDRATRSQLAEVARHARLTTGVMLQSRIIRE